MNNHARFTSRRNAPGPSNLELAHNLKAENKKQVGDESFLVQDGVGLSWLSPVELLDHS